MTHFFIHGGPFKKTSDWIGSYGCVDSLLAWKFLEADLSTGSSFTHQLVPGLVDDVYLHARVRRHRAFETPAGRFLKSVEVVYLIDYGVSSFSSPDPTGGFRMIAYGMAIYAPGVGPVFSRERNLVPVGEGELGQGSGEVTLELVAFSPGTT